MSQGMNLVRGVVLEGSSAAGKTSVLRALRRRHAARDLERSVVILGEHYSQALKKGADGTYAFLPLDAHRSLLLERLEALEALARWGSGLAATSPVAAGVFFTLERFHLNHRLAYEDDMDWTERLEERLRALQALCVLLTVSADTLPERLRHRLRASGNAHDASSVDLACARFLDYQERPASGR